MSYTHFPPPQHLLSRTTHEVFTMTDSPRENNTAELRSLIARDLAAKNHPAPPGHCQRQAIAHQEN